jgi:histidinol-phosphate aminotransferase
MKSLDVQALVRKNVRDLKPYSSARDDFHGAASVFLDANENPVNTKYNRYPDPHQVNLKRKISEIKKVGPDNIFLGNGSDEAIDLLFRAFCEPGLDNVVIPEPTYGMYRVSAGINNVAVKTVALTPDFAIDLPEIEKAWDGNTKLLFLCSPNNPSGNLLSPKKIEWLLAGFKGIVVVDEAYIDFTDTPGLLPDLVQHENLVILQTLSKAWGLAGIRLGMCFASAGIIEILDRIKPPYNINTVTQSVALEYLEQETRKDQWVSEIKKQREVLKGALSNISFVREIYPSDANFLLVKVENAASTYQKLVDRGIIIRDRSKVILCENCLRITVGTADENKQLINQLTQL